MPRGYYLGQGLIPLGYSSSDDEEGPCELPDGRIVCGPHGLVYCGRCCTDYSDMNDALDDDEEDEEDEEDDEDVEDSDAEEDESEDKDKESDDATGHLLPFGHRLPFLDAGVQLMRGTGKVFPTKFVPSNNNTAPL